jgi:hypothetical protein
MTFTDMLDFVKQLGVAGGPLFFVLFWLERNERKDAQKELRDVAHQTVVALTELKAVVSQLTQIFHVTIDRRS